jgi:hypothetical protein
VTDRWRELLEHARWAPSPHNGQQWLLQARSDESAQLLCDPARLVPAIDPTGAFAMVGLGAFIETLAVVARAGGQELEVTNISGPPAADAGEPAAVAELRLHAGGSDHLPVRLVHRRRTSRLPYDGRPVEGPTVERLERACARFGHRIEVSSDPKLVGWLLQLDATYLLRDLRLRPAREELAHWLRYSNRSAAATGDGFSPAAMDVPGWMLRVLVHAGPLFGLPPVAALVRKLHNDSVRGTATAAWLAGPFETPEDWITAGRAFCRVSLELTADGIFLQPLGSIIDEDILHHRLNPRRDGSLWIVVRMGTGREPARSHRLPVERVLVAAACE